MCIVLYNVSVQTYMYIIISVHPKSAYIILIKNEAKKNGFKFAFCVHIQ